MIPGTAPLLTDMMSARKETGVHPDPVKSASNDCRAAVKLILNNWRVTSLRMECSKGLLHTCQGGDQTIDRCTEGLQAIELSSRSVAAVTYMGSPPTASQVAERKVPASTAMARARTSKVLVSRDPLNNLSFRTSK